MDAVIVEEKITGPILLCRLHPDPADPKYTGQWILTEWGEIKGLMILKATPESYLEFGAWLNAQPGPLKLSTAVESVERAVRRWRFKEMMRPEIIRQYL